MGYIGLIWLLDKWVNIICRSFCSTLEALKNHICCKLQIHVLLTYILIYLLIYSNICYCCCCYYYYQSTTTTTTVLLLQYILDLLLLLHYHGVIQAHMGGEFLGGISLIGRGRTLPKVPPPLKCGTSPKLRKFPSPRSFDQVYCTLKNPVIAVIQLLQSFNCISLIIW